MNRTGILSVVLMTSVLVVSDAAAQSAQLPPEPLVTNDRLITKTPGQSRRIDAASAVAACPLHLALTLPS
jgi:hypothetical protein